MTRPSPIRLVAGGLVLVAAGAAAVPLVAPQQAGAAVRYVVRPGDTLSGVAAAHRMSVARLARANHLSTHALLLIGERLLLPGAHRAAAKRHSHRAGARHRFSYRVQPGDSLSSIARRFGVSMRRLARINGLDPSRYLIAGSRLRIPHGGHAHAVAHRPARASASGATHSYRVQRGDTLSAIAARSGSSLEHLRRLNPQLAGQRWLVVGAVLRVPGRLHATVTTPRRSYRRYVVRPGDSLGLIAARFGTTARRLARTNGMRLSDLLPVGRVLRVPGRAGHAGAGWAGRWPRTTMSHDAVRALVDRWAAHYGVSARLARAIAWQESGFQTGLYSSTGAWGVMQVMPGTWAWVEHGLIGHAVAPTPDGNVHVGVRYLRFLLDYWHGNRRKAVASYYQGALSVRSVGMYRDTRQYVHSVMYHFGRV